MNDAEKALLKKIGHEFFDVNLPALLDAEELRLPVAYQGMVKIIVGALLPQLIAAMDAKIDTFVAGA